jgi:4-hydroxy 2-oxovalerate aldolase
VILDCTFRDGGYYVNWKFNKKLVKKYLKFIELSKIDIIEIGFRFIPAENYKPYGNFAYSTDDFLNQLDLPKNIKIAVMVNADEILKYNQGIENAIKLIFNKKINSRVDIVRIATHWKDVYACKKIAKLIKILNYKVFLNIMQINSVNYSSLTKICKKISKWKLISTLYFADSLGSMNPDEIVKVVNSIKKGWNGPIGIHAHNNKGQALSNSLIAHKLGVSYLDSTICGMGRGAGNVKTENLIIELSKNIKSKYFAEPVFSLSNDDFKILKNKYKWGENIYYHLSANFGIHPTYVQEMLADERYGFEDILKTLNFLKLKKSNSYKHENLLEALNHPTGNEKGSWSAKNFLINKNILILGSGPSINKNINFIKNFIKKKNTIVFSLNLNKNLPSQMIDYYVACNFFRILIEMPNYENLKKPLICPKFLIESSLKNDFKLPKIYDYGLKLENNKIKIFNNGCVLPKSLAIFYAISIAISGGAKNIFFSGIDGYIDNDIKQKEIIEIFKKFKKLVFFSNMYTISPTTYPIKKYNFKKIIN